MKIIIWGVTPLGRYLARNIKHNNINIKPMAYIDRDKKLLNTSVEGVPVLSYDQLEKENMKETTVLLAVKNAKSIFQIFEQLDNLTLASIGIVKPLVLFSNIQIDPCKEYGGGIIWKQFEKKIYRIIPRIEVNLIDACNLKCKGCTHFSSIYKKDSVYRISDYKRDLLRLRNVGEILRLRLLGGEPFLLNNLDEYIILTREIFPETDIEIVTNGLLIPKINEMIMRAVKSNDVSITISPYQPTLKRKKEIIDLLEKKHIPWHFDGEEILEFTRSLTLNNTHDAVASNEICLSSSCTFMRKGKIYKCPFDGLINDFYKYYNLNIHHESGMSIYEDEELVYKKIVEYALSPVKMCKYCSEKPEYIPWSVEAKPTMEDWLYKGGLK